MPAVVDFLLRRQAESAKRLVSELLGGRSSGVYFRQIRSCPAELNTKVFEEILLLEMLGLVDFKLRILPGRNYARSLLLNGIGCHRALEACWQSLMSIAMMNHGLFRQSATRHEFQRTSLLATEMMGVARG